MTAPPLVWLPGALDDLEHAVVDSDVVRAGNAGLGEIAAVCSASAVLCSLATPACRRCPDCDAHATRDREPRRDHGPRRDRSFKLRFPWSR